MINQISINQQWEVKRMPRKVIDPNSLAFRAKMAREAKGLTQTDVAALMNEQFNIRITASGYSKIEKADTDNPRHEVLIAMKKIFGISLDELIEGEHKEILEIDAFITDEANRIGAMVDQLPQEDRQLVEEGTRIIYQMRQKERTQEQEIIERDNQIKRLHAEIHTLRTEKLSQHPVHRSILHDVDSTHE